MKPPYQEQIRTFHLAGLGLQEFSPAGQALKPVLLAQYESKPQPSGPGLREMYGAALKEQRGKARSRFLDSLRYCRDRMQEILALDDQRDPQVAASPSALAASMGSAGSMFDSGTLAVALQTVPSPVARMSPGRRLRCELTLTTLAEAFREAAGEPECWEFQSAAPGAIEFCERQLEKQVATLRAMRTARLEMEAEYDQAIHDDMLARFTWESADAEELSAMPAVLVMDSAEVLAEQSLTTFGRLLRSGMPMQILLTCPRFYSGNLAFLAVSHHEAFVMQSSMACPEHLKEGLLDMTHTLRPAVAIVATEDPALFHESQCLPMFVYDPDAGEDWIERFKLHPAGPVPEGTTAVHVAATYPELQRHFRILPKGAWSTEQMPLDEYFSKYKQRPPLAIPYINVVDETGAEHRAIVTRDLVKIARERQRSWRLIAELSEAGKPLPPPVDTEAIRKEGERQAIFNVMSLLNANGGGAPASAPAAPAPIAVSAPSAEAATAAAASSDTPVEAFIESSLCTSCNDCMKINSRMFLYNGDRQAYIGDVHAGTFAELVKAAEGCPAKCIHPGAPQPGDKSATVQMIARAAKYN